MFAITTEIIYVEINARKDLRFAIALKIIWKGLDKAPTVILAIKQI